MKNKLVVVLLMVFALVGVTACGKKENKNKEEKKDDIIASEKTNALLFKQEYEALNGKENARGMEYRTVNISEDNPYVYQTADQIVDRIKNGETFYVYFGDTQCPWCRSNVEMAASMASEYDIDTIYYVKIWDESHNEILRDKLSIDENGNVKEDVKGTDSYYELLTLLDDVLSDYKLSDDVEPTEKRIYAPNYIYIENGKPVILIEGISEAQENAYEELTEEMLNDEKEAFKELFDR